MGDIVERTLKPVEAPEANRGSEAASARDYVLRRYEESIRYYWKASALNRRLYKWTRYLVVVFGAVVTLLASISSSSMVTGSWTTVVAIATPVFAAVLTIIGGLSQSFQWGTAWQEMVLTAQRLERERDRILVTRSDPESDLELLNTLLLKESEGFFTRILGSVQTTSAKSDSR